MRTEIPWGNEVAIESASSPEHLWNLVADVTRMGAWSPECHGCEWSGGATGPAVGARFVGQSRRGPVRFSRTCEVTASQPGREFAFRTLFRGAESVRWRYRFDPTETGTRVSESFEVISMPPWVRFLHRIPGMRAKARRDATRGMTTTLERLLAVAETD
jgi:uncharacterized protein YndB with AHSA1/START domain